MEKKAEAYQRYNKAAMAEMMIKVLPEIAGKIAEPLRSTRLRSSAAEAGQRHRLRSGQCAGGDGKAV